MTDKTFRKGDGVIFRQRIARHLSINPNLTWSYEMGNIVYIGEGECNICWLQGHHSRNDEVKDDDIVSVYDKNGEVVCIGGFKGPSRILQPILEEGEIVSNEKI